MTPSNLYQFRHAPSGQPCRIVRRVSASYLWVEFPDGHRSLVHADFVEGAEPLVISF